MYLAVGEGLAATGSVHQPLRPLAGHRGDHLKVVIVVQHHQAALSAIAAIKRSGIGARR
jgi:hypothetical protein